MTKKIRRQIKGMDEGKLMVAISKGIQLAAYDFMHTQKKEMDAKAYGLFKWILHRLFALGITWFLIWLVNMLLHGRAQKFTDWIIKNVGN